MFLSSLSSSMQIASAMVVCTFVSAPLMFVSAKMISLATMLPPDFVKQLNAFAFDVTIASGIACVSFNLMVLRKGRVLLENAVIATCFDSKRQLNFSGLADSNICFLLKDQENTTSNDHLLSCVSG